MYRMDNLLEYGVASFSFTIRLTLKNEVRFLKSALIKKVSEMLKYHY